MAGTLVDFFATGAVGTDDVIGAEDALMSMPAIPSIFMPAMLSGLAAAGVEDDAGMSMPGIVAMGLAWKVW